MLLADRDPKTIFRALWAGVCGFVPRPCSRQEVVDTEGLKGNTADDDVVLIKVGDPADEIAMVVGNANLSADDQAIYNRLAGFGFNVNVVSDGLVNTKLTMADIGVYCAEQFLQDDLLFTGDFEGFDYGEYGGQTNVVILDAGHPLAAGLSGTVQVTATPSSWCWGAPTSAVEVVELDDAITDTIVYGFETNAVLFGGTNTAPARRVQSFFQGQFSGLNADGLSCSMPGRPGSSARTALAILRRWSSRHRSPESSSRPGIGILEDTPAADGTYEPTPWPLSPYTGNTNPTQTYYRVRQ